MNAFVTPQSTGLAFRMSAGNKETALKWARQISEDMKRQKNPYEIKVWEERPNYWMVALHQIFVR